MNPFKILSHNLLQSNIGRMADGTPIWDESALFNTNSFPPFIELLSAVHIQRSGSSYLPADDVLNALSTALPAETETILDFCRLYAYSANFRPDVFASILQGTAADIGGPWLAKSNFRLFEFSQLSLATPADVTDGIRRVAVAEANDIVNAFLNLTIPANIMLLNPAVYTNLSTEAADMEM